MAMAHKWTKASRAKLSRSQKGEMEETETAAAAEALGYRIRRDGHATTSPKYYYSSGVCWGRYGSLAYFYCTFRTAFLWGCYHQIFRPRSCAAKFANRLCRHSEIRPTFLLRLPHCLLP